MSYTTSASAGIPNQGVVCLGRRAESIVADA